MRAHHQHFRGGELNHGVFRDHNGAMSTDWTKYSDAAQSRARARVPADNAIISLPVLGVRAAGQVVRHDPIAGPPDGPNRAHTNGIGVKTTEVRFKLHELTIIEIAL